MGRSLCELVPPCKQPKLWIEQIKYALKIKSKPRNVQSNLFSPPEPVVSYSRGWETRGAIRGATGRLQIKQSGSGDEYESNSNPHVSEQAQKCGIDIQKWLTVKQ